MTEKKFQIFVSSTYSDLKSERSDAIKSILDMKHLPSGMESFPAADVSQLTYIKKLIDECDYYLLIIKNRYGSEDAQSGLSFTELEYDYAIDSKKIVLAFIKNISEDDEESDNEEALLKFRSKVSKNRLVKLWDNSKDLKSSIIISLNEAFGDFPAVGWIRGDRAASTDLLEKNNALLQENAELKQELSKLNLPAQIELEGLAGLDIDFSIRGKWWDDRVGLKYFNEKVPLRLIFLSLAGLLDQPKLNSVMYSAFKRALMESGMEIDPTEINETDQVQAKIQLIALGLVHSTQDEHAREALSLTKKGHATFVEYTVNRKPGAA